jgi:hypothetical protein
LHPDIQACERQEFHDAAYQMVEETNAITARLKARHRDESGRLIIGADASPSADNRRATPLEHRRRVKQHSARENGV